MEGFGNASIQEKHLALSETSSAKSGSKMIDEQEGEVHCEKMAEGEGQQRLEEGQPGESQ